jgi:hypothetical protein
MGRRLHACLYVLGGLFMGVAPSLAGPPPHHAERLARVIGAGVEAVPAQPPRQVITLAPAPRPLAPSAVDAREPLVPPAPGLEERRPMKPAPIGPFVDDPWDATLMLPIPNRIRRQADISDPWIKGATVDVPARIAIDANDPW